MCLSRRSKFVSPSKHGTSSACKCHRADGQRWWNCSCIQLGRFQWSKSAQSRSSLLRVRFRTFAQWCGSQSRAVPCHRWRKMCWLSCTKRTPGHGGCWRRAHGTHNGMVSKINAGNDYFKGFTNSDH